jgi:predicted amidohydrolase YtcJ
MSLAGELLPDQRVTPEQALRMWTINAAHSMSMEHLVGSLEPGKLADVVILSGDPLTEDDEALLAIRIDQTFVGGRSVFERATATT